MTTDPWLWAVALGPLGLAVAARFAGRTALAAAAAAVVVAFSTAVAVAIRGTEHSNTIGMAGIGASVYVDGLGATMFCLVSFIGLIVVAYSRNYLDGDPGQVRFTRFLCLTLAAVLLAIVSGNLAVFACAWIATSLGLNRLLLFYPERRAAAIAARKEFLASRAGDVCLLVAAYLLYHVFGTLDYARVFADAAALRAGATAGAAAGYAPLHAAALLIVVAALLKSAQFPTHGWLLEVMETPTPVSALLHAGIVNAGGFLVLRFAEVVALSLPALDVLAVIGGITALFGSVVMLTQTSIKVTLAYSTIAQMGYMMLECGLGAFPAALLHVVAHSLYKAHAFLSSGSVIDIARASWTPSPGGKPHPARLAIALAAVVLAGLVVGFALGPSLAQRPGVFAFAVVLALGLIHLVANAIDERPNTYVVGRTLVAACGVAIAYFALQAAAEWLTSGSLPRTVAVRGPFETALLGFVLLAFAMVTFFLGRPKTDGAVRWRALYAAVASGFYVNTTANRAVVRWMTRRARADEPRETPVRALAPPERIPVHHERAVVERAIAGTCARVAPLWPLKHFVAANPFLGFTGRSFASTCAMMHRVARVDMLMPRSFYRAALDDGTIADEDLRDALAAAEPAWPVPPSVASLREAVLHEAPARRKHQAHVATVAEVLDSLAGGDRDASRTAFMTDEISRFCAAYFDEGQSAWRLPGRDLPLYAAWRAAMRHDRNPETMGIRDFRELVARLPDDPIDAIGAVLDALGIPERALEEYLHQALFDIGGWASYARYLAWNAELAGASDERLVHLLAIRIVWGYTLFSQRDDAAFADAWARAMEEAATSPEDERLGNDPDLAVDLVLHEAYELAFRRRFLARLAARPRASDRAPQRRPDVQAAFCIDVRSEIFRRAFESLDPGLATIGFAGFFGYPIEYVPIGQTFGGAQCPVLLRPAFVVCEAVEGASDEEDEQILDLRRLRRRANKAWKSFKISAVSSFTFVETAGIGFGLKILSDALAVTRTVNDPNTDGLDRDVIGRLGPRIAARTVGGRETGFTAQTRVVQAEAVLRGMSLTSGFARLVLMTGHGSTTVNNPHASGLDCGACGGHTGEANARVAATILNDRDTRRGLRERGITIPDDTWFLGCLHDTTTDEVTIFDAADAPASHRDLIEAARARLASASSLTRRERARRLGIPLDEGAERRVIARSRDWAQVRPEWGLAGNAAFVAAPRSCTRGTDLDGRAFLHDYDRHTDPDGAVLASILSAPMVVASWINLQYYGSTVNNRVFGAGNKVLHNVTGTIGVLEGNAGDLKSGLPLQSVHDGVRFVHEPLRLCVFVAAPPHALDRAIVQHPAVRELVDNRWLHLFAMADDGAVTHRCRRTFDWEALPASGDVFVDGRADEIAAIDREGDEALDGRR